MDILATNQAWFEFVDDEAFSPCLFPQNKYGQIPQLLKKGEG